MRAQALKWGWRPRGRNEQAGQSPPFTGWGLRGGGWGAPADFPGRTEPLHLLDARDSCDGIAQPERRKHGKPRDGDAFVQLQQQQHEEGDHEEELQDVGEDDDDVGQPKQADSPLRPALSSTHATSCLAHPHLTR